MPTIKGTIQNSMALAFFASAYADQAEECGQPLRGEIMEQLPDVIDPAALHAARQLLFDMVAMHGCIEALYSAYAGLISAADFGHYSAMQAMGHGVGLWEYGIELSVPYAQFGSYGLEVDYFTPSEEE